MNVKVEEYKSSDTSELSEIIVQAMQTNPLHLAAFGPPGKKTSSMQKELFSLLLRLPSCNLIVAKHQDEIVGVMNFYLPGQCQLSFVKTLLLFPRLISILGSRLFPVLKWKRTWAKHDPTTAHLHFGPFAVLPAFQGAGIGSAMLSHFCQLADEMNQLSYLETDKEENVILYERFGFRVLESDILLGVKNWFMLRPPQKNKSLSSTDSSSSLESDLFVEQKSRMADDVLV